MNLQTAIYVTLALIAGPLPAPASTLEHIRAVNEVVFVDGGFRKTFGVDDRRKLAVALTAYWESLASRIPRLSPSEQKWLDTEMASKSDERVRYALNRKEFALSQVVETATNCLDGYRNLSTDIGVNAKREALRWARTLGCYEEDLRTNMLNAGLIKAGDDPGPIKLPFFGLWPRTITGPVLGAVLDEPNFR